MKTGSGIYHTGGVGKDCHVAAKLREAKPRDRRQRIPSQERDTPAHKGGRRSTSEPSRRRRKRGGSSSSRSPSPKEDDPKDMRKELSEMKKLLNLHFGKSKGPKHAPEHLDYSDSESSDSSTEFDRNAPDRKSRNRTKGEHRYTSRRTRSHHGNFMDLTGFADLPNPGPGGLAKHGMDPGLLAALPGLAAFAKPPTVKLKSGEDRSAIEHVTRNVTWPHERVRSTRKGDKIDSHNITLSQHVFGFIELVKEAPVAHSPHMLSHLQNTMKDVDKYGWDTVRELQGHLYHLLETGVISWTDINGMTWFQEKMAFLAAPRYDVSEKASKSTRGAKTTAVEIAKLNPCKAFQNNTCEYESDHDNMVHLCSYHLKLQKKVPSHGEHNCMAKRADQGAKNGSQVSDLP